MTDLDPIPSTIDTHRAPSLSNVESKLFKLIPALDAFASELAALPRSARRVADSCNETLAACPPELDRVADVLRVLSGLALTFSKDIGGASRELVPIVGQIARFRRQVEIAFSKVILSPENRHLAKRAEAERLEALGVA
jgi:hypothetical protein